MIHVAELVTVWLVRSGSPPSNLLLATGYFKISGLKNHHLELLTTLPALLFELEPYGNR